jgi:hypothetical protein
MQADATRAQLVDRLRLDRDHHVETWRRPDGSIVLLLTNRHGEAVQGTEVPRMLGWSKAARRFYRHRVVRRWILTAD